MVPMAPVNRRSAHRRIVAHKRSEVRRAVLRSFGGTTVMSQRRTDSLHGRAEGDSSPHQSQGIRDVPAVLIPGAADMASRQASTPWSPCTGRHRERLRPGVEQEACPRQHEQRHAGVQRVLQQSVGSVRDELIALHLRQDEESYISVPPPCARSMASLSRPWCRDQSPSARTSGPEWPGSTGNGAYPPSIWTHPSHQVGSGNPFLRGTPDSVRRPSRIWMYGRAVLTARYPM
jgi:hypothetical protein